MRKYALYSFYVFSLLWTNTSLASVLNNIYDANGYLIAECAEDNSCRFLGYTGVSNTSVVTRDAFYQEYIQSPAGKIASVQSSSSYVENLIWLGADFHGTNLVEVRDVINQRVFDAFGNQINRGESSRSPLSTVYTDKQSLDSKNDIYNFNARFYDAVIGRFFTPDPLPNMQWFSYVNNSPLMNTDSTGQCIDTTTGIMDCLSLAMDIDEATKDPSIKNVGILVWDSIAAIPGNPLPTVGMFAHGADNALLSIVVIKNAKWSQYLDEEEAVITNARSLASKTQKIKQGGKAIVTEEAYNTLHLIEKHNGQAPPGYVDAIPFRNRGKGERLPEATLGGKKIEYTEYDVHPSDGGSRGNERIVIGRSEDGYYRAYQTNSHYEQFSEM